jgi:hypothetical protein
MFLRTPTSQTHGSGNANLAIVQSDTFWKSFRTFRRTDLVQGFGIGYVVVYEQYRLGLVVVVEISYSIFFRLSADPRHWLRLFAAGDASSKFVFTPSSRFIGWSSSL